MTPKEKAEYLIRKMTIDFSIEYAQSKLCAIVCCDEILNTEIADEKYWQKVKQELDNL